MRNLREEDMLFGATLHNVKFLRHILKSLTIVEDVILEIEKGGMRLTVEDGLCIQASLFIPQEIFAEYYLKPQLDQVDTTISFALNLSSLTNCLRMTSDEDCKLIIIYSGAAYPLVLAFNRATDSNIAIEAELKTKSFSGALNFHKHTMPNECNTIIMKGINFAMLFNEIDVSSEEIAILLSPREPYFLLRATGRVHAEATVQVAKTSNTIVQFNCTQDLQMRYRSSHIRFASKCLAFAHTVALTIYNTGLLNIELLVNNCNPDATAARRAGSTTTHSNILEEPTANLKYFITPLLIE
ncbi:uncharacterized protein LOC129796857 [Lutzomyia longipalpis]|uniref:uncharacterized protein LOC129796857 n=1 Tax=Lutzomyia longipalpis TaxID=7200 RepID=UPI0024846385|nr:uncharacterized protein LOC129796857 [Lutzomyia longipalpis]